MPVIREAATVRLFLDGVEQPSARVLNITQGMGNSNSCTFRLEDDGIRAEPKLADGEMRNLLRIGGDRPPEVDVQIQPQGLVHNGFITRVQGSLGVSEELVYTSSNPDEMFGDPLAGRQVFDHPNQGFDFDTRSTVFNPKFEGRTFGNRRQNSNHFLDPELLPFDELFADVTSAREWTLREAVFYIASELNGEEFFKNPSLASLNILPEDPSLLRGHALQIGKYLPSALDDLLHPYGFDWFIDFLAAPLSTITVVPRQGLDIVDLELQAYGETLDTDNTVVKSFNINYDIAGETYNYIEIYGDFKEFEMTVELIPAWKNELDTKKASELDAKAIKADPSLERVWRDWVLNEAGDYRVVRVPAYVRNADGTTSTSQDSAVPFQFGDPNNFFEARRRRFRPTISLDEDYTPIGRFNGVHVEIWNGRAWVVADEIDGIHRPQVLQKECGIRLFHGAPPPAFMAIGIDTIRVRVTATIVSDRRVAGFAIAPFQHTLRDRERFLDMRSAFHFRQVDPASVFAVGEPQEAPRRADVDDEIKMNDLAERLLESWNQATCQGRVVIEGCDYDPGVRLLGNSLATFDGRNLGLKTSPQGAAADFTYPVISGITYNVQDQETELDLSSARTKR